MVITTTVDSGTPTVYTFNFQYDASGTPMSVVVNGSEKLYYVTNLQGDVTALLDEDGDEVAEYTYSAYGEINPQVYITGTDAFVGAMFNPLKYRGYVHDIETDWYYLQSRYYDPEIGRFLNADALTSTGQGFAGNNMFAYCLNNPISYTDSSGYRSDSSMIEQCIFEGCVGDTAIMKLYNRQIQSYEYNGIELYYSEEEALRAWSDIYLPLSYDCEYATLLYSIDTPLGKRYFTLDGIPGGPMQCIFPTIDLWIRDFLNGATLIAQVHTHPHPSVGGTYCLSFPSANYNRSNPGDLLAKNILGFPDVYVIPYNQCLMPNFYCKLSDASTWCPHCDFLHLYS